MEKLRNYYIRAQILMALRHGQTDLFLVSNMPISEPANAVVRARKKHNAPVEYSAIIRE
jgi:hypothetical protein